MAFEPVVFLPGLGGSTLSSPPRFLGLGGYTVWVDPVILIAGGLARMRLAVPGEPEPPPPGPALVKGGPLGGYYGPLMVFLAASLFRPSSYAIDWRGNARADGAYVAQGIMRDYPGGGVRILTHSRGGLVARRALQVLQGAGKLGLVERVVCLGTPHSGALPAVSALMGYGQAERAIESLASYFPPSVGGNVRPSIVRGCIRSWPGVYELLPAPGCPWLQPDVSAALYSPGTYALSPLHVVPSYLSAAAASWADLPPRPTSVDWYDVGGYGVNTQTDVLAVEDLADPGDYAYSPAGDGVVLQASAFQDGTKHVGTPTGHNALPFDARLWAALVPILRSGRPDSLYLSGSVLNF